MFCHAPLRRQIRQDLDVCPSRMLCDSSAHLISLISAFSAFDGFYPRQHSSSEARIDVHQEFDTWLDALPVFGMIASATKQTCQKSCTLVQTVV